MCFLHIQHYSKLAFFFITISYMHLPYINPTLELSVRTVMKSSDMLQKYWNALH